MVSAPERVSDVVVVETVLRTQGDAARRERGQLHERDQPVGFEPSKRDLAQKGHRAGGEPTVAPHDPFVGEARATVPSSRCTEPEVDAEPLRSHVAASRHRLQLVGVEERGVAIGHRHRDVDRFRMKTDLEPRLLPREIETETLAHERVVIGDAQPERGYEAPDLQIPVAGDDVTDGHHLVVVSQALVELGDPLVAQLDREVDVALHGEERVRWRLVGTGVERANVEPDLNLVGELRVDALQLVEGERLHRQVRVGEELRPEQRALPTAGRVDVAQMTALTVSNRVPRDRPRRVDGGHHQRESRRPDDEPRRSPARAARGRAAG